MDCTLILNQLREHKGFTTDAEMSRFLDVSPQCLSGWKSRNKYDTLKLVEKFPEVNELFIISGSGPMLKNTSITQTSNETAVGQNFGTIHNNSHGAVDANHYVPRAQYDDLMDKAKQLERRVHELTDEIISLSKQLIAKQQ